MSSPDCTHRTVNKPGISDDCHVLHVAIANWPLIFHIHARLHTTRNVAFSRAKISFFKRGENTVPRKARKKRRQKVEDSFITKLCIMKCNFHDIFSALLVYYGSRHFVLFSLSRQKNWSKFLENALHRLIAVVLLRMNVAPIAKAIIHRNVDD